MKYTRSGLFVLASCFLTAVVLSGDIAGAETDNRGLEFGCQHRARFVDFDNLLDYTDDLDDQNRFFRFRTRIWGRLILENMEAKLTLANEFRHYLEPDRDDNYDEIFIDECYLKFPHLPSGWSAAIGRQNVIRGDGFLLFDGSPLDGSRTIYFNSVVITRAFGSSTLDILGISNPAKDRYLPRIGDKEKALIEQDEQAAGLYFTHKRATGAVWEATWLMKMESSPYGSSEPGYKADRTYHVVGGRLTSPIGQSNMLTCEAAGEFGKEDPDRTITAWAGQVSWKYRFESLMKPAINFSAAAFSGDDPDTESEEGWSPPFSRWPEWSELYIYSLVKERGVAFWSDLWFAGAEVTMMPVQRLTLRAGYYRMMAFEPSDKKASMFEDGKTRGDLFEFRMDFKLVKGLTGHALYEYFVPGDFYMWDDAGHFLRFELTYQFSRKIPI